MEAILLEEPNFFSDLLLKHKATVDAFCGKNAANEKACDAMHDFHDSVREELHGPAYVGDAN